MKKKRAPRDEAGKPYNRANPHSSQFTPCSDSLTSTSVAGTSTNINPLFSLFALEVILSAAFGMQADIQSKPDSDTVHKAKTVFSTPLWVRAFSMFPFSDYLSKKLNISPLNHTDYFIRLARVIYDARKAQESPSRKDLLQLMIEAQQQEIEGAFSFSKVYTCASALDTKIKLD